MKEDEIVKKYSILKMISNKTNNKKKYGQNMTNEKKLKNDKIKENLIL